LLPQEPTDSQQVKRLVLPVKEQEPQESPALVSVLPRVRFRILITLNASPS
jgi:hypothetical protein